MAVTQKMRIFVFSEFRPYLRFLSAYNIDNFYGNDFCFIFKNIFLAIWLLSLVIAIILIAVLSYWSCIDTGLTLDKLALTLPIILSIVQTILTHFSLSMNNRLISATIEFLQFAVDERKLFLDFIYFHSRRNRFLIYSQNSPYSPKNLKYRPANTSSASIKGYSKVPSFEI